MAARVFKTLLIAIYAAPTVSSFEYVCKMKSPKGVSARTSFTYEYGNVCYFVIDEAGGKSNSWTSNLLWNQFATFNVSLARALCNAYGATLPILKTATEQSHVVENYKSPISDNIAVDLVQHSDGRSYAWADGTSLDVKIPSKHVQMSGSGDNYSYTVVRQERQSINWYDYAADENLWNGAVVVCRQEFGDQFRRALEMIAINGVIVIVITSGIVITVLIFYK